MKITLASLATLLLFSCTNENHSPVPQDSVHRDTAAFNPSSREGTIRSLEKQHSTFIVSGKGDSLLGLYDDDTRILGDNSTIYSGKSGAKEYWTHAGDFYSLDRNMVSLNGNKELLYEIGIETFKAHGTDSDYTGNQKYLVIWKLNTDGHYR
ncbi:MAG TPA: hypothetical protein VFU15_02285, partial [Bacteroidia bacterium]|nr:hypothetical protein [Bacteroidia bacterium]